MKHVHGRFLLGWMSDAWDHTVDRNTISKRNGRKSVTRVKQIFFGVFVRQSIHMVCSVSHSSGWNTLKVIFNALKIPIQHIQNVITTQAGCSILMSNHPIHTVTLLAPISNYNGLIALIESQYNSYTPMHYFVRISVVFRFPIQSDECAAQTNESISHMELTESDSSLQNRVCMWGWMTTSSTFSICEQLL